MAWIFTVAVDEHAVALDEGNRMEHFCGVQYDAEGADLLLKERTRGVESGPVVEALVAIPVIVIEES